jgi:hypothetical protein
VGLDRKGPGRGEKLIQEGKSPKFAGRRLPQIPSRVLSDKLRKKPGGKGQFRRAFGMDPHP